MSKYMSRKYNKRYRERQRELKLAISVPKQPAMTNAERSKLYRERKKLALLSMLLSSSNASSSVNNQTEVLLDIKPDIDYEMLSKTTTFGNSCWMDNSKGEEGDQYNPTRPLFKMDPSPLDDDMIIKQEPVYLPEQPLPYDDGFIGSALLDSLRNVPDPMLGNAPRGKKNPVVTLDSIKKELTFECELCGKRFRKSADLFQHKLTHGEQLNCEKCEERFFKPWELTKHHMEKHSDNPMHKCEICSKTFIENWRLLRHMRTHSKEKNFKCEICDKAFSESGNLAKHKKQTHTKDRPYKCDLCDKTYPQKKDLQGHMLVHTMNRFICSVCKEEFALLEEKRAHVRLVHPHVTVEKSYTCTLCDATLNSKSSFLSHSLTHGERRFECMFCMKKFHTHARMRKHVRAHQVEHHSRCEICDKTFSQEGNMKRHIELMHMQGNRYYCLHCPLTFLTSEELKAHRISEYQNELPYKCAFCEKAFSHHQSLANHTKCHRNPKRHLKEFIKPASRKRKISSKILKTSNDESSEPTNDDTVVPLQVKTRGRPKLSIESEKEPLKDCPLTSENNFVIPENKAPDLMQQRKKRGRPKKSIPTATVTKVTDSITEGLGGIPFPIPCPEQLKDVLKDNYRPEKTQDGTLVPTQGKKRGRPTKNVAVSTIASSTSTEPEHQTTSSVDIGRDWETELQSEIKIEETDFIDIGPTEIQELIFDS